MIFLQLFWTFFKIGAFTFGGGYAMLPLIQDEVTKAGWLSTSELINFVAVSESTPGPFAVNISTYVGMETAGVLGAFCATLGVILPSFLIILFVAGCYEKFKNNKSVIGLMSGLKPAVVGLILATVCSVGYSTLFANGFSESKEDIIKLVLSALVFLISLFLILKKKHPILIIVLSAIMGISFGFIFGF